MVNSREKFNRLMNPKTVSDYGLSISFDELISFDEGKEFIGEWFPWLLQTEEEKKQEEEMLSIVSEAGENLSLSIDKTIMETFNNAG